MPFKNDFTSFFPSNGIAAEVGVVECTSSLSILESSSPTELCLIDDYKPNPLFDDYLAKAPSFAQTVKIFTNMSSAEAASLFNSYFDWVYIDTGESYEGCLANLELWYPKVKPGGVIAGHGYSNAKHTRTKRAVDEFCSKYNLKVQALNKCNGKKDYLITV